MILQNVINSISVKLRKLHRKLADRIAGELDDAQTREEAEAAIALAWKAYDVPGTYVDLLIDGAGKVGFTAFNKTLKGAIAVDGELLSKKLHDLSRIDEIVSTVNKAMSVESNWTATANSLVEKDITVAELPEYVNDMLTSARQARALTGDVDAFNGYQRSLEKATAQIEKLTDTDKSLLAQGYRNIRDMSLDASAKVRDGAVERAVMFKARSNAQRLLTTEVARAYGNAQVFKAQKDEDVVGIRWELSEEHDKYCECDFFDGADMYGMGAGVYPKDELPEYPAHPFCACELTPVYQGESGEYDDAAAERAFNSLDADEQQALVGKDGGWKDFDWNTHKVPEGMEE